MMGSKYATYIEVNLFAASFPIIMVQSRENRKIPSSGLRRPSTFLVYTLGLVFQFLDKSK